jgi:hypothetical protein
VGGDFRYRSEQVSELAAVEKRLAGRGLAWKRHGSAAMKVDAGVEVPADPWAHMRLLMTAGRADQAETYGAALLLDGQRIRGVRYSLCEYQRTCIVDSQRLR